MISRSLQKTVSGTEGEKKKNHSPGENASCCDAAGCGSRHSPGHL